MNCEKCGGTLKTGKGSVIFPSKVLGEIFVPNIKMNSCTACDLQILLPSESDKVLEYVLGKECERVGELPLSGFIGEKEAAEILGESKQAFNKNKRIQSGFIMFAYLSGRRFFLRESVNQFKIKKDGRFLLSGITVKSSAKNVAIITSAGDGGRKEISSNQTFSDPFHTFSLE